MRAGLGTLIVCIALAFGGAAADAAPKLRVRSVSASPASVLAGAKAKLVVVVQNRARRAARPKVSLLLSRTKSRKGRVAGFGAVRVKVKPHRKARARRNVIVPASASGKYRVIACIARRCVVSKPLTVVGGTGGGGTDQPGGDDGSTDQPFTPSGPFKPALDVGRAAGAQITTAAGGTLEATAADGTHFKLDLPPNAVPSDRVITMTPLAAADGLPYRGGLVGAVQFEPDGLVLKKTATLTITPSREVPLDRQSPFGWLGSDQDLHEVHLDPDRSRIVIPIDHFSGAGLADGSLADRDAQAKRQIADASARYEQEAARLINESRANGTEVPVAALEAILHRQHAESVKPALTAALTEPTKYRTAARYVVLWEQWVALLGASDHFGPELTFDFRNMDDAVRANYADDYARCVADHDPSAGAEMWSDYRDVQSWWLWDSVSLDPRKGTKCMSFELDVQVGTSWHKGNAAVDGSESAETGTATVTAIPFKWDFETFGVSGVTPKTPGFDGTPTHSETSCTYAFANPVAATADVSYFDFDDYHLAQGFGGASTIVVGLRPGSLKANWNYSCFDGTPEHDSGTALTDEVWNRLWQYAHASEAKGAEYRIGQWTFVGNGEIYARRSYKRTVTTDFGDFVEDTTLTLRHKPVPPA